MAAFQLPLDPLDEPGRNLVGDDGHAQYTVIVVRMLDGRTGALQGFLYRSHISGTLDGVPCRMMGRNLYTWPESRRLRAVSGVSFRTIESGMLVQLMAESTNGFSVRPAEVSSHLTIAFQL
jgi:hypothetical protein